LARPIQRAGRGVRRPRLDDGRRALHRGTPGRKHHHTVAAGHGAQVGIAIVEDSGAELYHDWTVPEGYLTERGREVPPGCAETDDAERERREAESLEQTEAFDTPHPDEPTMHPSVVNEK